MEHNGCMVLCGWASLATTPDNLMCHPCCLALLWCHMPVCVCHADYGSKLEDPTSLGAALTQTGLGRM